MVGNQKNFSEVVLSGRSRIEANGKKARRVLLYESEIVALMERLNLTEYKRSEFVEAWLKASNIALDEERTREVVKADTTRSVEHLKPYIEAITKALDNGSVNAQNFKTRLNAMCKAHKLSNTDNEFLLKKFLPNEAKIISSEVVF